MERVLYKVIKHKNNKNHNLEISYYIKSHFNKTTILKLFLTAIMLMISKNVKCS